MVMNSSNKSKGNDQGKKKISLNMVLLLISLLIVSVFGIIFVTQIEIQSGWKNSDMQNLHAGEFRFLLLDDLNGDSINETFCYFEVAKESHAAINDPHFGYMISSNGLTGATLQEREIDGPIYNAFLIKDVDGDGISDIFVNFATVEDEWSEGSNRPNDTVGQYGNQIISGKTLLPIPILTGDEYNFTHERIYDLVTLNSSTDFITLQTNNSNQDFMSNPTNNNLTSYHANGTLKNNTIISQKVKFIDLLPNNTESNLLLIGESWISLRSIDNFSDIIFESLSLSDSIDQYCIIDDMGTDGVSEFIIASNIYRTYYLINGSNGVIIRNHTNYDFQNSNIKALSAIKTTQGDYTYEFLASWEYSENNINYVFNELFTLNSTENKTNWMVQASSITTSLGSDFNGDGYPEIVIGYEEEKLLFNPMPHMEVRIVNGKNPTIIYAQIKISTEVRFFFTIPDIDGDNKNDVFLLSSTDFGVLSTTKPLGIWLSPYTIMIGLPIFIIFVVLLVFALYRFIKAYIKKEFEMEIKQNVKRFKISVIINIAIISIMIFMFTFFLIAMNVFNSTLLLYDPLATMMISSISVFITWFTLFPLIGAIFNKSSARFAFLFIRIRDMLFKFSKNIDHDIMVVEVDPKTGISMVEVVKRSILPLLLSLTVGFMIYTNFTPILHIRRNFTSVGGSEFYEFLGGYFLLAILPMVITFILFSFFISSGWLLDDAGIVYYHKYQKEHIPGDIERVSVWQQGWIKGLAGFSSLITFINFAITIDLTSLFTSIGPQDLPFAVSAFITTSLILYGFPFLTGFCFMFFAIIIMEVSIHKNRDKLYKMMQKEGYDVTPMNLENRLFPSGLKNEKKSP